MPNGGPEGARPATPIEVAEWERFKTYYNNVLSKAVLRANTTAEIANQAQAVIDKHGIPGFIFDQKSLADSLDLLNRFNIIGRYIAAVESGKYGIRLANGDIDILASPAMEQSEYEADMYPTMGIAPIIWALGIGVVLVAGLFGVSSLLDSQAEKQEELNKSRLMEADKEMMKQPNAVRNDWIAMKKAAAPAAKQAGILAKFLGTEGASAIGAGAGIGLALLAAAFAVSHWRRS